ncbi:MAG: SusC/RagA family TonB-linked outer membrane protein, partial [Odoribacter sp.]|nr:SusC/RagA family TonB-linked outer membrane protein [Odoribacter sp.]
YRYRPVMGGDERRELIAEGLANKYMDGGMSYEWAHEYAEEEAKQAAPRPKEGYSDWESALFRKGHQQSYDFSVMGGNENTRFAGNIAYTKQENVARNAGFERFSGHVNFNNYFKKWDIGMNALVSITKESPLPEGGWYASPMYGTKTYLTPSTPIYNEDGSFNTNLQELGNTNPVYENSINKYRSQIARTFAAMEAGYTFIQGLRLSTVFNVDYTYTKDFRYFSPNSADGETPNGQGDAYIVENITYNSNTRLNYVKEFGEHSVDVLAAYEIHNWDKEYLFGESKNYTTDKKNVLSNASTPVAIDHYTDSDAMLSYVLRGNYDYADKYYLSVSFRRDGSSRLSPKNRWNNFWAVSGSWRVSKENFMGSLDSWLTDAKVRASYGVNGNVPTSLYGYFGLYSLSYSYNDEPAMVESSLANDKLSWERNYAFNVGVDVSLIDRINVSFDWYRRKTKDLLLSRAVNPVTGFGSIIDNVGQMENKGVEVEIRSSNMNRPHFTWSTSLSLTHNKNKVIRLADVTEYFNGYYIVKEGLSLGTLALREYAGVNPDDGRPMYYSNMETENGRSREIIYDPNDAAVVPLKDSYPKLTGGLSNTFRYRFVDLSLNFSFSLGGYTYDSYMWALQDDGYGTSTNKSTELRRRWKKPGDQTDIPRYVDGQEFGGWWHSSRGIHSTDHLRLKSLTLGVNAPERWLQPIGFSSARIYFSGTNLLTWARYDQYDPELSGVVGLSLPPLKTYAFGIEISF